MRIWISAALVALAALAFGERAAAQDRLVTCESVDKRTTTCHVGRHSSIEVQRRLSDVKCKRGRDWWDDDRSVTVTDGCRATFAVYGGGGGGHSGGGYSGGGYNSGGGGQTIVCESHDNRATSCPIGRARDVRLVRRLSNNSCNEGEDWQVRRGSIEVYNGCRAEFEVY